MRLLVATSTFPRWEGDTVPPFVHRLSQGLAAKGHDVHVLAPHAMGARSTEEFDGLTVHRFRYGPSKLESLCYQGGILENLRENPKRWSLLPSFLAAEYMAIARLVSTGRFDAIHAHWVVPQGFVAALPRLVGKTPLVISAHGADVFASRGMLRPRLLKFAAQRAAACTANSTAMQTELRRQTGVDSTVIPMGVDTTLFAGNAAKDGAGEGHRVLFVGRLAEKKRVIYLVRAMARVRAALPDATLVIVGDGPDRAQLEAEADLMGLGDGVKFVGAVPNTELPAYYAQADVFVAPSVVGRNGDTEGLGVVLLEAAAAGVPLVASDVGGIPDIVQHEQTGLLVEPEDPEALAASILRVLTDRDLAPRLSDSGRQHVNERFSWGTVVDRFDDLFSSLRSG
jgi:glycosyltransferase involved in cell wall biosynthesis